MPVCHLFIFNTVRVRSEFFIMADSQLSREGGYGLTGEGAHGVDVCAVILVKINFTNVSVVNCGTNVIDAVRSRMRWVQ